jgi:two-component system, OmpR family, sensor kinase
MFRSIRWTVQAWHAVILASALVSFGMVLYMSVEREQMTRVDSDLEGAAGVLANGPLVSPFDRNALGGWALPTGAMFGFSDANDWMKAVQEGMSRWGSGMNEPRGPNVQKPGGLPAAPPSVPRNYLPDNPWTGFIEEWWAKVRQDALRRIGQSEQDQPYFMVWGFQGNVLRASSPNLEVPRPDTPVPWAIFAPTGNPQFRQRGMLREVILQGPFGTRILVGKSLGSEETALRQLRWRLLGVGIAVMAIGLLGGGLLSRRATRPIERISETAKAISASDLSRRITVEEAESELGSLAQTLNATFDRLETAFQQQVRFTADASHELRTPLSIIHSHAELALAKERTTEEYKKTLETCLRAAKRTKSLVEALLVLARADAGKLQLKYERFDLRTAAEESLAMVASRAEERNLTLETHLESVVLEADSTRVLQLLTNLLVNAIQYNQEGGRVVLAVAQERSEAVVSVADTGVGIAVQDQPHVFERFFRADKARSREAGGSGLGLAICQSIVEAHHGSISFTSRPGEGTTFIARLPLCRQQ